MNTLSARTLLAALLIAAGTQANAYDVNQPGGGYVARLYQKELGRAPDEGGFSFWVGEFRSGARSLEAIAAELRNSWEAWRYRASQEIAQYYRDLFGVEADPGGLAYWTDEYTSGRRTMANIRAVLASYTRNHVDGVYREILHRPGDPGGLDYYVNYLAGGKTLTDLRYELFYSAESYTNFPGAFASVCDEMRPHAGTAANVAPTLQACIDQTPDGGTLAIPRGKYMIGNQVRITRPITLATQFKGGAGKCAWQEAHDCAELKAAFGLFTSGGMLVIQGPIDASLNVTLDHLVVNGNKEGRIESPSKDECRRAIALPDGSVTVDNSWGTNIWAGAHDVTVTNSVFKNALCGTGFGFGWGNSFRFQNNTVAFNGYHDRHLLWADGLTAMQPAWSVVSDNEFMDNTDVDLVFGQCFTCTIQNNAITHSNNFATSSFAAFILHAWPGFPARQGSTSGDYRGADVSGNFIDCVGNLPGSGKRCGFGLLLGASAWYESDAFQGFVHDNVINGAQQGFSIDKFRDPTIANNYVTQSGGTFATGCGARTLTEYNITGTGSVHRHPSETIPASAYASFAHDGCIPNWWANPY